jgi:hypothetical protein
MVSLFGESEWSCNCGFMSFEMLVMKIRVVVVIAPSAEARAARAVDPRVRCNVKCVKCNPVPVMCVSRRGPEPPPCGSRLSRGF